MASFTCDYCGLPFSGRGYLPDDKHHYCCYGCCLVSRIVDSRGDEGIASWILIRLGVSAFLAMNVMMISVVLYVNPASELGPTALHGFRWALVILSTPAMVILGTPFFAGALRDLKRGSIGTDILIVTGSTAAYSVSAFHVICGRGEVYFDTATMLLLIVTLGRLLEASAKSRTSRAINGMLELTPDQARVLRDGNETDVPASEVRVGERLIVKPGERVPVDGRITSGSCLLEEAAFTGEARPRSCSIGDRVYGGSVNRDGFISLEATATNSTSLLAQIQDMVRLAQRNRAAIERLAERAASIFVPVVWLVAAAAFVYWAAVRGNTERAGLSALATLVVACPCALGLATPMVACLAIGKAARAGVLIRSGEILECLSKIDCMYFDKTGTLTANNLRVSQIRTASRDLHEDEALAWAASLLSGSEHSIALAVVREARSRCVPVGSIRDFRAIPGFGVEGTVVLNARERRVTVGSLKLLCEHHELPESLRARCDESNLTATYVGWSSVVQAGFLFENHLREQSLGVIDALKAKGIKTALVSGDREQPTLRTAEELGVAEIFAECSPKDKADLVRKSRIAGGRGIAFVGDGINDAPALAEADVGIAVGGGTDLARQAGDVTLLGDDLSRIAWVLDLARESLKIIRQNLFWAFGYNCIAISLAFFGFVHPLIAAAAMVMSSLSVMANSMRLLQ